MTGQPEITNLFRLEHSARAWGTPDFAEVLKQELAKNVAHLPLHQALLGGNHISDEPVTVMINSATEMGGLIQIKVGIFFKGLLMGCSCSDDPGMPSESNEYCEAQIELDRGTATARLLQTQSI